MRSCCDENHVVQVHHDAPISRRHDFVCGCDSSEVRYLLSLTCSEWDEHTIAHFHQLHRKQHIHFHSRIVEVGK